jgi:hypothetical protein
VSCEPTQVENFAVQLSVGCQLVLPNEIAVTLHGQNALAYFKYASIRKMKGFIRLTAINQIQVHSEIAANEKKMHEVQIL